MNSIASAPNTLAGRTILAGKGDIVSATGALFTAQYREPAALRLSRRAGFEPRDRIEVLERKAQKLHTVYAELFK
jgi:hypothetical protein